MIDPEVIEFEMSRVDPEGFIPCYRGGDGMCRDDEDGYICVCRFRMKDIGVYESVNKRITLADPVWVNEHGQMVAWCSGPRHPIDEQP